MKAARLGLNLTVCSGFLAFFGGTPPPVRAQTASGPVVHLPQVTVKGTLVPPDRENWRYLEIPGFEILSEASDARTTAAAANLLGLAKISERTFPALRQSRAPDARIILCTSRPVFESFVPAAVRSELNLSAVDRLFLGYGPRETVVLYLDKLAGAQQFEIDLANDYLQRRLVSAQPLLPRWYVEGVSRIFAAANVIDWSSHTTIAVGKLDDRAPAKTTTQDSSGSMTIGTAGTADYAPNVTSDVAQAVRGDLLALTVADPTAPFDPNAANPDYYGLSFKRYFAEGNRPVLSLEAIFSGPPRTGYADWSQACCLLVHYCLFGQNGQYAGALQRFFTPAKPATDEPAAFHAAFGKSYADMQRQLGFYLGSARYKVMQFKVPARAPAPAVPAPREATDGEIADLKAGAYIHAGYPERAWTELTTAYQREKAVGKPEPRLVAALHLGQ